MSKSEEIRRQLGCDMIREEQQYAALHPRPKQPEKAPEQKAESVEDALNKIWPRSNVLSADYVTAQSLLSDLYAKMLNESPWRGLEPANGLLGMAPFKIWYEVGSGPRVERLSWKDFYAEPEEKLVDVMEVTRQMCGKP